MKKMAVAAVSLVLVLLILWIGGVFSDLFSLFEEKGGVSAPISGVFYLYSDSFVEEDNEEVLALNDRIFVRLDYLKSGSVTCRLFGEDLSIQTSKERYYILKDGSVYIGTALQPERVEHADFGGVHYISLKDLSKVKGYDDFGIEWTVLDQYVLFRNSNMKYETATLEKGTKVFATRHDFDQHVVALNKGAKSVSDVRGVVEETPVQGYCYRLKDEEREYFFFVSDSKLLSGYVMRDDLKNTGTTEPRRVHAPVPKDVVLVWEAVYTDVTETEGIGEMPGLNVISPTWYTLEDAQGNLSNLTDQEYIAWARERGYKLWPLIFNDSNIDLTHEFLSDYDAQMKLINTLADEAVKHGYEGYNLDFEHIYFSDRDAYSHFVNLFSYEMRKWGIVSSVDVNVMDGADNWSRCYDHEVLGEVADLLIIMAYDQHHATSEKAGPNAAYNWVNFNLQKILGVVSSEKIILGVPFYTRVWETTAVGTSSEVLYMKDNDLFLQQNDFQIEWDEKAMQRKASYHMDGALVEVWLEDADSLRHKAALVRDRGLAGIAAWRRGYESGDVWHAISSWSSSKPDYTTPEKEEKEEPTSEPASEPTSEGSN